MNTVTRLAGFGLVLGVALGGGYGIGVAAGPLSSDPLSSDPLPADDATEHMPSTQADAHAAGGTATAGGHAGDATDEAHGADAGAESHATDATLSGLSATQDGYSLLPQSTTLAPDDPFVFTLTGPDGAVVTDYEVESTKELHLIAVRHDGADYRHVHPTRDAAGQWLGDVGLTPGPWRLYADTVPAGADGKVALGVDVQVTGDYAPATPGEPSRTAAVGEYAVTLDGGPAAGQPSELRFAVTRAGRSVAPEPYLGAAGHLVVIRESDRGYLHVHPEADALAFTATFPTPGRYLLFLDVKVDGQVRTAPFSVEVNR